METATGSGAADVSQQDGLFSSLYVFFFGNPLNTILTTLCAWLLYRLLKPAAPAGQLTDSVFVRYSINSYLTHTAGREPEDDFVMPEPLSKQDMTLEQLKQYDGKGSDGRVCMAILGKVYDCTKGRKFYGPGGPYSTFAGRDATRALATFDVNAVTDQYEDYSDLTDSQRSSVEEWQLQLSERYEFIGHIIRPEQTDKQPSESKQE